MKAAKILITIVLIAIAACKSGQSDKGISSPEASVPVTENSPDKIEAYYFHFTARCEACRAIEDRAKENLETLYPAQTRAGLITFKALNLDDPLNRPVAEKLGVAGQTLLLVKGDQKINLTNEGFLYAIARPIRFREIINEKVEFLLSR